MNRQIKFRVWDVEQNKFLSSYADKGIEFYHEQGKDWHEKQVRDIVPVSWFLQDHNNNLENYIVTQYTGLTDKNNKPIYEGDIVKYKTWTGSHDGTTEEHQTQVQFKDGAYYPRYIDDECEDSWYSFKVYDIEIIGNVFETPHLDENEI